MMIECNFKPFPNMVTSCMDHCEYLKSVHYKMKYPKRVPPEMRSIYERGISPEYKDRLSRIFDSSRPYTSKGIKGTTSQSTSRASFDSISSKRSGVYKQVKKVVGQFIISGDLQIKDAGKIFVYTYHTFPVVNRSRTYTRLLLIWYILEEWNTMTLK